MANHAEVEPGTFRKWTAKKGRLYAHGVRNDGGAGYHIPAKA